VFPFGLDDGVEFPVLADDVALMDFGAYGGEATPKIDAKSRNTSSAGIDTN